MNPLMQSHIDSLFQGDNPDMRCIITISNPYGDEAIQVPGKESQYDACKNIIANPIMEDHHIELEEISLGEPA